MTFLGKPTRRVLWTIAGVLLAALCGILLFTHVSNAASTTTLDEVSAHVPEGHLICVDMVIPGSDEKESVVLDYEQRLGRSERPRNSAVGSVITTYDAAGHWTLDCYRARLFREDAAFDTLAARSDLLRDVTATRVGEDAWEGVSVVVYTVRIGDSRSGAGLSARVLVDEETGLRVREEWTEEGETVLVVTRRVVARTAELSALLRESSLGAELASLKESRESKLAGLSYRVYGLADGGAYILSNVVPGPEWNSVRLEYSSASDPSRLVAVVSCWDLARTSGYPTGLQVEMSSAVKEVSDAGTRLSWVEGTTAIQLQVYPGSVGSVEELAESIITRN